MEQKIPEILADIKAGECVIIVGPDLFDHGGESFFDEMCADFGSSGDYATSFAEVIDYVFKKEQLLSLKNKHGNEANLRNMMKRYYEKQDVFNEPLKKISSIPFKLIISLMPDDRLINIFEEQGFNYDFGFYPVEDVKEEINKLPTIEDPLIYNLLGSFKHKETIVTFDSMFVFLSNFMKEDLPIAVKKTLMDASTIIFLGVHFEWWHTQLILRRAMTPPGNSNTKYKGVSYALANNGGGDNVNFIKDRLGISFLEADSKVFLDKLYDECRNSRLLKNSSQIQDREQGLILYDIADTEVAAVIAKAPGLSDMEIVAQAVERDPKYMSDYGLKIQEADFVIVIVSASSLFNLHLMGALLQIKRAGKFAISCFSDGMIFNEELAVRKANYVQVEIRKAVQRINGSMGDDTTFWEGVKAKWVEFDHSFDELRRDLEAGPGAAFVLSDPGKMIATISDLVKTNKYTWKSRSLV